ncbi:MAG: 2OG-Fe(II) oxygenase [Sphingomonadaceae bacterium]|nr:2OG-Fe(II) oxygenase [Sphingomonadaceae bacterium]
MTKTPNQSKPAPDRKALARLGKTVRARLEADPLAYKVPVDNGELFAISDFLSPDECTRVMGMIDAVARPSELFEDVYKEQYRTSFSGDVDANNTFVRMIERRVSDLLDIDISWGESIQGQRYEPGQQFREHCDWFDTAAEYWQGEIKRGGQRSWTAMIFLNDVEMGGATEFLNLGARIAPQRGALLVWNNATLKGDPNHDTLHAALPVERGAKYVLTKWFRTRPWS